MKGFGLVLILLIVLLNTGLTDAKTTEPLTDLNSALEKAKAEGKMLFIQYGRDRCGNCQALKALIAQRKVKLSDSNFVYVDLDCDNKETQKLFYQRYKVEGRMLPWVVIADSEGNQIMARSGYGTAEEFNTMIKKARKKISKAMPETEKVDPEKALRLKPKPVDAVLEPDENREMRTWMSKNGTEIKASLVKEIDKYVVLKKEDGSKVQIPLSGLSDRDQKYILELKEAVQRSVQPVGEPDKQ